MELIKKNIHRNQAEGKTISQITLDEDFIVPDVKEDMESLITDWAEIEVEDKRVSGTRCTVKGKLCFHVLYHTQKERMVDQMEGELPFEEVINLPQPAQENDIALCCELEDLTTAMINSRKLNVKAVITLTAAEEALKEEEVAVELSSSEGAETTTKAIEALQLAVQTRDIYRIKEEVELSASKPNIAQLLWSRLEPRGIECRPLDGKLSIHGELELFCIYRGEEEHIPLQWLERSIPFSGAVELPDCTDEMIPDIRIQPTYRSVEAAADYDGEMRLLSVECVLELDIRLYEEERMQVLDDIYCPGAEVILQADTAHLERLITRNASKHKLTDKLQLSGGDKILQICHADGVVKIEETQIIENGIRVEGSLWVDVLYVAADDMSPVRSLRGMLPFEHVIEAEGIGENAKIYIKPSLEQLSAMLLGNGEMEIKAVPVLDSLVLEPMEISTIKGVQIQPLDREKMAKIPGIVGYVVQKGDTLWKIAKKFYVSVDSIREVNGLTTDDLQSGQRLLIVKETEALNI